MDKTIKDIKERRSVRVYVDKEISNEIIEDIVDCARLAPSANNQQSWRFVAIKDKKTLEQLSKICQWGKFLKSAGAAIIVFSEKDYKHSLEDGAAATENILLAAKAYGIGSCWIAGWKRDYNPEIEKLLNAPSNLEVISILSLGYFDKEVKAHGKEAFEGCPGLGGIPMKKMIVDKNGKKFFLREGDKEIHTQHGFLKTKDIDDSEPGAILKSNMGHEFTVVPVSFIDEYSKIKRMAQIIPLKDIGQIIVEMGLGKDSILVESGSGSGATACFLGNIVKEVHTFEIREDFFKIVKGNIEKLGLKNIKIKNQDFYKGIDVEDADAILLDLPEPWMALDTCMKALKVGGFIISYSPCVPQVDDFVREAKKRELTIIKTTELLQRDWEVEGRKIRPKNMFAIGHSGFLTIARKIKK